MKTIVGSSRGHYVAIVSIFSIMLIMVALIAGMTGCGGGTYNLTIASSAGGKVTEPGEGTFPCSGVVNLVAEALEGYPRH